MRTKLGLWDAVRGGAKTRVGVSRVCAVWSRPGWDTSVFIREQGDCQYADWCWVEEILDAALVEPEEQVELIRSALEQEFA